MLQSSSYYMQPEPKPHNPYQDPRYAKYEKYGDQQELEAEIERDAKLLFKKKQLEKIEGFTGYFEFMRPDFPSPVYYEGETYSTAAHAYNAAKLIDPNMRRRIQKAPTLQEMYNVARTIEEPEGWTHKKLKVMERIMRDKFRRSRDMRERLAATQNREIINFLPDKSEENLYWGMVGKQGQNQLGKILERVRQSVHDESEMEQWMQNNFNLVEGRKKLPSINLEVFKDGQLIESITLENKPYYVFGAHPHKCDVVLKHPSMSRVHAAFLIDQDLGVVLIDLMSKAKTKLDDQTLEGCIPHQVKANSKQKVIFGLSTRVYQISIDYSKMQRAVEIEKKNLEREMRLLEKLDNVDNIDMDTLKSTLGLIKQDTIYVSNLPYSVTEQELMELFNDCGKILSIRMPENKQTKQNRGFAFITMADEKAARRALNYDGHKFYNRRLKVNQAEKKAEIEERRINGEDFRQGKGEALKNDDRESRDHRDRRDDHRDRRHRSRSREVRNHRERDNKRDNYDRDRSRERRNRSPRRNERDNRDQKRNDKTEKEREIKKRSVSSKSSHSSKSSSSSSSNSSRSNSSESNKSSDIENNNEQVIQEQIKSSSQKQKVE
ncbi:fha domain containing protein [Stylonychia lemnae]|uniref:Fha domain containing protein n=1 Tax=Stylonychia lemnae TaxID=5949 RepID=A0A077ZU26_STYLE|nr:fha domain containing protein [Stylonychia lemnae]|eukprot:CDW73079.1 fha domain containing protein [Stylonychia lemnae]